MVDFVCDGSRAHTPGSLPALGLVAFGAGPPLV